LNEARYINPRFIYSPTYSRGCRLVAAVEDKNIRTKFYALWSYDSVEIRSYLRPLYRNLPAALTSVDPEGAEHGTAQSAWSRQTEVTTNSKTG